LLVDSGTTLESLNWNNPDVVYVLNGNVTVANTMTLTIGAGQFIKSSGPMLIVDGTLNAQGTLAAPVIFTSLFDDKSGGDTNNDGSTTKPAAGNWSGVQLNADSTSNMLTHVWVLYAGAFATPAIYANGGPLTLIDSIVSFSGGQGVKAVSSAQVQLTN